MQLKVSKPVLSESFIGLLQRDRLPRQGIVNTPHTKQTHSEV
jgi:hypothetical protein